MHGIYKPHDIVQSVSSPEWHGLADVVAEIDDATVEPLLFNILQGRTNVEVDEPSQGDGPPVKRFIPIENRQTLVADLRPRSLLPQDSPFYLSPEDNLIPLHSPKNSYTPISNRALWEVMKTAIKDIGGRVVTAGTFSMCRKFFISVDIGSSETIINKDQYGSFLNFVTSHDGELALTAHDSHIRQVCRNTVMWSLEASGTVGFKVYHTKNSPVTMTRFAELLNAILLGRAQFKLHLEMMDSVAISSKDAQYIVLAYFNQQNGGNVSPRTINASEEISHLFANGVGNHGRTLYDLFNGCTEYYTHGGGVGKESTTSAKLFKAQFGTAAEHKYAFTNFLITMDREEAIAQGEAMVREYESRIKKGKE